MPLSSGIMRRRRRQGERGLRVSGRGRARKYRPEESSGMSSAKVIRSRRRPTLQGRYPFLSFFLSAYTTSATVSNLSVEYIGPLRGRGTLARRGASAHERASRKGSEQKHPRVGARALLQ